MGLVSSIAGVYMLPVSESLGVGRGEFSLWITVKSFTGVILMPVIGRLYSKMQNINILLVFGSLCMTIGILGFSFSTELWMFYAFAPLLGIGSTTFYTIGAPTLIQAWFAEKHRGKFMGIAAAFTGIGTFVWAPLFTYFLQSFGWRTAYLINAIFIFVLTFPFALVAKRDPADKGLKPYGYDPNAVEEAKVKPDAKLGCKSTTAIKHVAFWLAIIGALALSVGAGFNNNQPGIAEERLVPLVMDESGAAMVGAMMISVAAVGNLLGKIIYGALVDKIGLKITTTVYIVLFGVAMILWIVTNNQFVLLVGSFFFGMHNAIVSVGFPMIIRGLFGGKNFAQIWSWWSMPFTLLGGFSTSIIGFVYAAVGSTYTFALMAGVGCAVLCGIGLLGACAFIGKVKWDDSDLAVADK